MANEIRVVLVDDHELIRTGLAQAFERAEGFEVVGQAGNVADALAVGRSTTPDVVVTDVRLPDGTGLDIVRALRAEFPEMGLVVLTMDAGDDRMFAAMDAGASGFVGKDAPSGEVISAARQAAVAPLTFTAAGLVEAMMRRRSNPQVRLTERETEVLQLLADGLGIGGIAGRLYISESTAKAHVARIYEKLGAANRAQALMAAIRAGLIAAE